MAKIGFAGQMPTLNVTNIQSYYICYWCSIPTQTNNSITCLWLLTLEIWFWYSRQEPWNISREFIVYSQLMAAYTSNFQSYLLWHPFLVCHHSLVNIPTPLLASNLSVLIFLNRYKLHMKQKLRENHSHTQRCKSEVYRTEQHTQNPETQKPETELLLLRYNE